MGIVSSPAVISNARAHIPSGEGALGNDRRLGEVRLRPRSAQKAARARRLPAPWSLGASCGRERDPVGVPIIVCACNGGPVGPLHDARGPRPALPAVLRATQSRAAVVRAGAFGVLIHRSCSSLASRGFSARGVAPPRSSRLSVGKGRLRLRRGGPCPPIVQCSTFRKVRRCWPFGLQTGGLSRVRRASVAARMIVTIVAAVPGYASDAAYQSALK